MSTTTDMTTQVQAPAQRAEALTAAVFAFALGLGMIFMIGFSHSATVHNAAHDTRHALSFPCH